MKILAIEIELDGVVWENETETLKAEAQQVYQHYLDGYIREIYFNQDHKAVLVLECDSTEKASAILNELPLVKNKLIEFVIMELNPYDGFSRLFEK
jgi:hypothetical protein